ncbi:hypothetical protein F7R91_14435 [Streptomyces luteolifulvus]|uniref:Uncharacterized protein n=1 Tax=Streptomyces luteolifulvus TaxID=2615112 RepID=A0A6H9UZE9_9ACTN|nr:hypothetical protein [Streptomyces luteolifulvus]KAB1146774.1 hypothetical protein F7R91_14435 [Streptomyces luteolifulvus]
MEFAEDAVDGGFADAEACGDLVGGEAECVEVFDLSAADGGEVVALRLELVGLLGLRQYQRVVDGCAVPGGRPVPTLVAGEDAGPVAGSGPANEVLVVEGDDVGGGAADSSEFTAGDVAERRREDPELWGELGDGPADSGEGLEAARGAGGVDVAGVGGRGADRDGEDGVGGVVGDGLLAVADV